MGPKESIRDLVEPLVTASGCDVWDVECTAGLIRVLVDGPQGVDLDTLGEISTAVSSALDARDDLVPGGRPNSSSRT